MLFVSIVKNQKAEFKMGDADVMKLYLNKTEAKSKILRLKIFPQTPQFSVS